MQSSEQFDTVVKAMQKQGTWTKTSDAGFTNTIIPLYHVLANLAQHETIHHGDIDQNTAGEVTALLVTDKRIYYAQFQTKETTNADGNVNGREIDGNYGLKIAARSQLKTITVDRIRSQDHNGEPTQVDYTVKVADFQFSIPIRYSSRYVDDEFKLLYDLGCATT